jgi:futalosine hydrolase
VDAAERSSGDWILLAAAATEAKALLRGFGADPGLSDAPWALHPLGDGIQLLVSGIGKANAAGAVGRFADPARHSAVLNVGVAGTFGGDAPRKCQVVLAEASVYADEGVQTPSRFIDCAAMGFQLGPFEGSSIAADPDLFRRLRPLADCSGQIATVSTCSGVDGLAAGVRERTGAIAECMEGAAAAHIARRLGIPFAELRVISNTVGDRERQVWDLPGALAGLERVARSLREVRRAPPSPSQ